MCVPASLSVLSVKDRLMDFATWWARFWYLKKSLVVLRSLISSLSADASLDDLLLNWMLLAIYTSFGPGIKRAYGLVDITSSPGALRHLESAWRASSAIS